MGLCGRIHALRCNCDVRTTYHVMYHPFYHVITGRSACRAGQLCTAPLKEAMQTWSTCCCPMVQMLGLEMLRCATRLVRCIPLHTVNPPPPPPPPPLPPPPPPRPPPPLLRPPSLCLLHSNRAFVLFQGWTPVHCATSINCLVAILAFGADIDAKSAHVSFSCCCATAIHLLCHVPSCFSASFGCSAMSPASLQLLCCIFSFSSAAPHLLSLMVYPEGHDAWDDPRHHSNTVLATDCSSALCRGKQLYILLQLPTTEACLR